MIEVERFAKRYAGVAAVSELSFRVAAGEILGLVGQNGAGKTTTLRALAGVVRPDQGRLAVAGHDVVAEPLAAKRRLGYIPDDPQLFDSLTVWEHVEFTAAAYRVADFRAPAERLLAEFQLGDRYHALAHGLSLGMRQKLAIVCAYLSGPSALVFDEPLTGLDPHGIRTIQDSIRRRAAAGAAVVISSHLLGLVENLCTHLLVLHRGRCLRFGAMREVLAEVDSGRAGATLEQAYFAITGDDAGAGVQP